jgi:hypothetical protein
MMAARRPIRRAVFAVSRSDDARPLTHEARLSTRGFLFLDFNLSRRAVAAEAAAVR